MDHWMVWGTVNPWGSPSPCLFLYYYFSFNLAEPPLLFHIYKYLLKITWSYQKMIQETEYVILNPLSYKPKIIQCLCPTHTHSVTDILLKTWEVWSTGWNVGLSWMNLGSLLLCDPRSHFISLLSDCPTNFVLPACITWSVADTPSNR